MISGGVDVEVSVGKESDKQRLIGPWNDLEREIFKLSHNDSGSYVT